MFWDIKGSLLFVFFFVKESFVVNGDAVGHTDTSKRNVFQIVHTCRYKPENYYYIQTTQTIYTKHIETAIFYLL